MKRSIDILFAAIGGEDDLSQAISLVFRSSFLISCAVISATLTDHLKTPLGFAAAISLMAWLPVGMMYRARIERVQEVIVEKTYSWFSQVSLLGLLSGLCFAIICSKVDQLALGSAQALSISLLMAYFVTIWNVQVIIILTNWRLFEGRFVYLFGVIFIVYFLFKIIEGGF